MASTNTTSLVLGAIALFALVACCVLRSNAKTLKQVSKEQFYAHIANLDSMQQEQSLA